MKTYLPSLSIIGVLFCSSLAHSQERADTQALLKSDSFKASLAELRNCMKKKDFRPCLEPFWLGEKIYFTWGNGWKYVSPKEYSDYLFSNAELTKRFLASLEASTYPRLQAENASPETIWVYEGRKTKTTGSVAYLHDSDCYRVTLHRMSKGWQIESFDQVDACGVK